MFGHEFPVWPQDDKQTQRDRIVPQPNMFFVALRHRDIGDALCADL
ncbi:hypothetical protein [Sphingomonas abietis]|uniref:Uncharacterized protein n=1 Tax=Sphingomonas abietis TaxID=3012344 RepID=A0ABY7NRQ9_9SPHN|nr:hypothetical protein [Sphingomonas abietis]WBO24222.1 hypothetical protein PBT88_09010 [Sphingomonas abietis]